MPLSLFLWTSRVPQSTYGSFLFILSLANSLKKEIENCFKTMSSVRVREGPNTTKGGQDSCPCKSFSRTADPAADSHICNNITCLTILKGIFMARVPRTRSESADGLTCDCQDGVGYFIIIASLYIGLRRHVI